MYMYTKDTIEFTHARTLCSSSSSSSELLDFKLAYLHNQN